MGESRRDPWLCNVDNNFDKSKELHFEDNFSKQCSYQKLEDSEQYLACLENKLSKLKTEKGSRKNDLLKCVEDTYDSYMVRLISNGSRENLNLNQDLDFDKSVNINIFTSKLKYQLNPEQALTVGELAELLRYDALSKSFESPD